MKKGKKMGCLTDNEIALFVDHKAEYNGYDRVVGHLAVCRDCLEKTVEIERLLKTEEAEAPRGLAERAFRKSAIEIGRSMSQKLYIKRGTAASLAAALVFVLVLAGVYYSEKGQENAEMSHAEAEKISAVNEGAPVLSGAGDFPAKARRGVYKLEIKNEEFKDQPLMYAGYLYFLVSNLESPDSELFDKFLSVLSGTRLYSKNSVLLLRQGWFELFQKELSSLPANEIDEFAEGYILSLLYHSDVRGKVSRTTLEWGRRLALHASMDEIKQCLLYQNSDLFRE